VVTVAGFSASAHDPTLFIHVSRRGETPLPYVDDMISLEITLNILPLLRLILMINLLCQILVLRGTFLGLNYPRLRDSSSLERSVFGVFSIELLLLITRLLILPWSSMFTLEPLMVSILRIPLVIVTL
jgi:hypothetical protein